MDIQQGRLSYNTGQPLKVSRLDTPRGAYFVIDGHHRLVEAILSGKKTVAVEIDKFIPRIERTGGSHRHILEEKANVYTYLNR